MGKLNKIFKISSTDFATLKETGQITKAGVTYKYDPDNLYLIENNLTDDYVLLGAGGSKLESELSVKYADTANMADDATHASRAEIANYSNGVYNRPETYNTDNPVWHSTSGDSTTGMYRTLHFDSSFTYNPSTDTLKVPHLEGTATEAKKVINKLTVGTKTYDGSTAVSLTKADLGLENVDNISLVSYTEARGDNLITNGNGIMGNNYNFPALTFDPLVTNNCKGSFRATGQRQANIKEKLTLDFSSTYTFSCDVKVDNPDTPRLIYVYLNCYDTDGFEITPSFTKSIDSSATTLAKDLKNGDTIVYLKSTSGFIASTASFKRGLIFWNYKDSLGYDYGDTYSRNRWDNLWTATDLSFKNDTTNTITLAKPWTHGEFKAGTKVSQCDSGATYAYIIVSTTKNTYKDWTKLTATFNKSKLRPATRKVSVGFLCQWPTQSGQSMADLQMWISNVNLSKTIVQNTDDCVKTSGNSIITDGQLVLKNTTIEYPLRFDSRNGQNTYIDFLCDGIRYNSLGIKNKTNDLLWNGNRVTTVVDLSTKVDKVSGKQLSTNDYTTEEKNKLAGLINAESLTTTDIDDAIK